MLVKGSNIPGENIRNILLIQLGDIGDVVWSTPTFRAVKERYSRANVSVLLREGVGSLLEADPHIHTFLEVKQYKGNLLEKAKGQIELIRGLRERHFDLVFDLRSDDRGAYMALLSGAPIRAALFYPGLRWRNFLFTHLAAPILPEERTYRAAEQSLLVVRGFGIDAQNGIPKLWVSRKVRDRVKQLLDHEGVTAVNRWITLNPFSRWQYKEWGYEKWVRFVDWLWAEYKISTVLVGGPEERGKSIDIVKKCNGHIFNLIGRTTLGELAAVLNLGSLHIGVDSAAPQIAAAVGTPTMTLYGPSVWSEWAPLGAIHTVITPDCDCAPCHRKGCNDSGISKCLEELPVEKVMSAVNDKISACFVIE